MTLDSIERKVAKLEAQTGEGGGCPHDQFIIWPDGTTKGERVCPICGRPRVIIRLTYDS
jgi:hypothetical protein